MHCPHCQSTNVHGPVYSRNGVSQRHAVMLCRSCHSAFDAYEWYGATARR